MLEVLSVALENIGYATVVAASVEEALDALKTRDIHLILSDLRLPGLSGRDLLEKVKRLQPDLPVVIMTAYATMKEAVAIIKDGAFDYLVKPFDLDTLEATVAGALRFQAVSADNRQLRKELRQTFDEKNLVGRSPAIRAVRQSIQEISASMSNVLITGESGTGKDVVARAIHYSGPRASAPFVAINCAAIPESLLESELFGHVKGAFTGATAARPGRFVQADSGTLFLDEIGDMPLTLQAKILRCIQEKIIEPVGSHVSRKVDVRIIAATNQDLAAAISQGRFRQDLYYRLNVYPIALPPLREHTEDIGPLAEHFAGLFAAATGKNPVAFTEDAIQVMREYPWPGNVRELENCVERLSIVMPGGTVTPEKLTSYAFLAGSPSAPDPCPESEQSAFPLDLDRRLEEFERQLILRALEKAEGVQVKAAELLNISERSIWHRIKKLGIAILNKKEIR